MIKVAIMYDFDQTLCTSNMQEYSLLPALNIETNEFWSNVTKESIKCNMDSILSYMYMLIKQAKKNNQILTRELFQSFGKDIEYYPGVEEYFERINEYAKNLGIELNHFVISSGTKEIIEGCSIYKYFHTVYACEFHYDENGNADWPAVAINYTGKTQFLFRINKGSFDVYDNTKINRKNTKREIPFTRMVYIADGITDVPCMRLVKDNGGYSIAVYDKGEVHKQLLEDDRVNFVAESNYCEGSRLDAILKGILDKIAADAKLEEFKK